MNSTIKCPFCSEEIDSSLGICPFCSEEIIWQQKTYNTTLSPKKWKRIKNFLKQYISFLRENFKINLLIRSVFIFIKGSLLLVILVWVIIYQNNRISELEKDLWEGFAFESTTSIVDRLANEVDDLKSKTDDLESNNNDTSSLSSDIDSRVDDLESDIDKINNNLSDMESDIRRIKSSFQF